MPPPPWRVLLLDTKRSNPNHYLCLALRDALQAHPEVARVTLASYGDAVARSRRGNFDLFLAFDGEEMDEALCARVAERCDRSVLWVTEDPYERAANVQRAGGFDLVLTTDSASVAAYGPGRARHLPLAAGEAWHFQALSPSGGDPHPYLYDVFFAGTAWPNRVALLRRLTAALPELKYKVALPFNEHLPAPDLGGGDGRLSFSAISWRTPNGEFCRLANRSRITLGLPRDFSASEAAGNPTRAQTPGPRLFEVALAGGFQLVDGRLTEAGDFYQEDEHFATFADAEDCVEKVRYYLDHPGTRETIARAAQQATRERHLYRHRVDQLLAWAAEIPSVAATTTTTATTTAGAAAPDAGETVIGSGGRPRNLLFVAHSTLDRGHFGGVEVVMDLLGRELPGEEFRVFTYVPTFRDGHSVGAVLRGPGQLELRRWEFPPVWGDALLTCPAREAAFAQVLHDCAVDLVHYHHLLGHVPSLPLIARAYGVPGTLTVYDYFHACISFNLLDFERKFCRIEDKPPATCDVCLNTQFHHPRGAQDRRRSFFGRVFDALDALIFISRDSLERLEKLYPHAHLAHKALVVDLPVPYAEKSRLTAAAAMTTTAAAERPARWQPPYRVVSFGNFTHPKGADVMLRAFNQLRDGPFEFHLYGRVDEPYPAILQALNFPNVRVHGQFPPGGLREALGQAALSLHVSIWPETFCITVAEAMLFGVVPIVSDVGAPRERVADGVNGFKVPPDAPGALVDLLDRLGADPTPAIRCHEHLIANARVHGVAEHAGLMAEHYRGLLAGVSAPTRAVATPVRAGLTLPDCGVALAHPSWCLTEPPGGTVPEVSALAEPTELPPLVVPEESPSAAVAILDAPERQATRPEPLAAVSVPHSDPSLYFNPGHIWRRAVRQTRERGLLGSARWHGRVLLKLVRGRPPTNHAGPPR